jgi:hypothetical protein
VVRISIWILNTYVKQAWPNQIPVSGILAERLSNLYATRIVKDPGNDSPKGYNTAMIPSDLMHPEFNDCRLRLVLLILMIFAFICGFADLIPQP